MAKVDAFNTSFCLQKLVVFLFVPEGSCLLAQRLVSVEYVMH
jgi:hypothetical protein